GGDGVCLRVILKRVVGIGKNTARDIAASTCVDEVANSRRRYVTQRNWEVRLLLPPGGTRSELPDLGDPNPVQDVEPAKGKEVILEYCKASRKNRVRARWPVATSNR